MMEIHAVWLGVSFLVGGLIGWFGGYAFGWLVGQKDTDRRWANAADRAAAASMAQNGTTKLEAK